MLARPSVEPPARDAWGEAAWELTSALERLGLATPSTAGSVTDPDRGCSVLRWAASGAMWLTGPPEGPPLWPAGDVVGRLEAAGRLVSALAGGAGAGMAGDAGALLADRAAWRGWSRRGPVSAGGRCRLLRTADGWVAVTLARSADREAVPALLGGVDEDDAAAVGPVSGAELPAWRWLARRAREMPAAALAARAQLLGVPAGPVPGLRPHPAAPWSVATLGRPARPRRGAPTVVDFSAMWAGPLCAHLLGLAGAQVVKVEDPDRPDAARVGDRRLFDLLHRGHRSVTVPFATAQGRSTLHELVDAADVVVEASRPRALAALGLDPATFCAARPGRTWVSITGHGRAGPRSNWVAFGDDAAAAGGLLARAPDGGPVFCADAVADPVSGLYAALAALASIARGGGHLVDCAMARAAAFANAGSGCRRAHHVERTGDGWVVSHADRADDTAVVRRPPDPPAADPAA